MAVKAYSATQYNNLGDIRENAKLVSLKDIFELGQIIKRHGHVDGVCVLISHRHFDLNENEVMYEINKSGKRIAEPRPLFDVINDKAKPNFLSCGLDGLWYPMGYEETEYICMAWEDASFLADAAKYLLDNNLTERLALVARRSIEEKRKGINFMEENFFDIRRSVTRPSTVDEIAQYGAIPTTYSFDNDAQTAEEGCNVCNNCGFWNH